MPRRNTAQTRRRVRRSTAQRDIRERAELVASASAEPTGATLAERRGAVRASLTASGDLEPAMLTNYDLTHGSLAQRYFYDRAVEAGYSEVDTAWWPTEAAALELTDQVVFRVDADEAVFRLDDGTLAYARLGYGGISVHAVGPTAGDAVDVFRASYPASYLTQEADGRVPITFWMMGSFGPQQRLRRIDAKPWADVERNYGGDARAELSRVMSWSSGDDADGQLLLWQGLPGTGKTWALRALASEWAPWAEFHYITDPDQFFGKSSSYMIDVLLSDSYMALDGPDGDVFDENDPAGKWKILILEDTGDLLAANARESYGQGLARLLNVVDGMIGQGLRVLALVTTNDQLSDLHPAVTRPGRCASQLEFGPLSAEEATAWLGEDTAEGTIAELFARAKTGEPADLAAATCANCDHPASMHDGPDGECLADGCDCDAYMAAAAEPEPLEASFEASDEVEHALLVLTAGGVEAVEYARVRLDRFTLTETVDTAIADAVAAELAVVAPELPAAQAPPPPGQTAGLHWTAILCPEGEPTDDGRIFAPGSVSWRDLPLTLMGMIQTADGHDGAQVCGRIDRIWKEGNLVMGEGEFDAGEFGSEIARMVSEGTLTGVSVDIAIAEMELAYRGEILDEFGEWIGGDLPPSEAPDDAESDSASPDIIDAIFGDENEPIMFVVWKGVIGAATVCPFPAFARASIETNAVTAGGRPNPMLWRLTHQAGFRVVAEVLEAELAGDALVASATLLEHPGHGAPLEGIEVPADGTEATLVAAGGPVAPPANRFRDPGLRELTALTLEEDEDGEGLIYGHAAGWGTCHMGYPDVCTTAPMSNTQYSYFHLKEVECDDGQRVSVGTITLDTGHAGARLGRVEATRHYDDTGTAIADVVCGEDEFGIWFSGSVRPGLEEEDVRKLRGAVLSGDWRNVNGNLELVALLAVNVPGFPVPRVRALVASGGDGQEVLALVAAGIHAGVAVSRGDQERLAALRDQADGLYDEIEEAAA